jgi:hypothetical protein
MTDENITSTGKAMRLFGDPTALQALIEENGPVDYRLFRRWTVSAESGLQWRSEIADGEEQTPTLQGVVIAEFDRRTYWAKSYEGAKRKSPPDCNSRDGIVGIGSPGGRCHDCPLSYFGSGKNQQPACRHYRDLLVSRPGIFVPECVTVPPASLGAHQRFRTRLAMVGAPRHGLLMSFGLEAAKNSQGVIYPEVIFHPVRKLTQEELATAERYVKMFATFVKSNARSPRGRPEQSVKRGR